MSTNLAGLMDGGRLEGLRIEVRGHGVRMP